jgi:hypothetical protein
MTKEEARKILAQGRPDTDPLVHEAYFIHYERRHRLDPLFDDGGAEAARKYKQTEQVFDPEEWPCAEFEENVQGYNTLDNTPFLRNPHHYATEETAKMLAEKLGAKPVFRKSDNSGPYYLPGQWCLDFGVRNKFPNAGIVGGIWNYQIRVFKRNIDNWNRNVGTNNPQTDPQTITPAVKVMERINIDLKRK